MNHVHRARSINDACSVNETDPPIHLLTPKVLQAWQLLHSLVLKLKCRYIAD